MRQSLSEMEPHSPHRPSPASAGAQGRRKVGRFLWHGRLGGSCVRGHRPVWLVFSVAGILLVLAFAAEAQPRTGTSGRQGPELPASGHQTEAIDLNEGKLPPQMFASDCAVCHQKPHGLAKGRSAGQLVSFLRQHYTTGIEQARSMASYLTSSAFDRGPAAPATARDRGPVERPPAPVGTRRTPDSSDSASEAGPGDSRRKPAGAQASRPTETREPSGRKPDARKPAAERQPSAPGRAAKPEVVETKPAEASATAAQSTDAPAAPPEPERVEPPVEEKPATPPPPPIPEIRI
jgi:hypothetical protein